MIGTVILCGGRGTRTGLAKQKCATVVAGRPFIHHVMGSFFCPFYLHQTPPFCLAIGYRGGDVVRVVGDRYYGAPPVHYVRSEGGTTVAASLAIETLRSQPRSARAYRGYWIVNGDTLLRGFHFCAYPTRLLRHSWVVTTPAVRRSRTGLVVGGRGFVTSVLNRDAEGVGLVSAGALLLRDAHRARLAKAKSMDELLASLAETGDLRSIPFVTTIPHSNRQMLEIDTPSRLAHARRILGA